MSRRRSLPVLAFAFLSLPRPVRADGLFPANPFSDAAAGTTSAAFLKQPPGARSQALAGSFGGAAGDPESLYWNPAGLAYLHASAVGLGYSPLLETQAVGSASYLAKLDDHRAWGVGILYSGQQPLDSFNALGDQTGSFHAWDYAASAVYARELFGAGVGLGLKAIHSSLAGRSAGTFAADFGVLGRDFSQLGEGSVDIGAYFQNLGPGLQLGSARDPLPFQAGVGTMWHAYPNMNVLADAHLPVDQAPYLSLGAEYFRTWADVAFALRAGYSVRNRRNLSGAAGLTAGFGLDFSRFKLDYAWVPMGELGSTHRVSLGFRL